MPSVNFSIEYFPPRNEEGRDKLDKVHAKLVGIEPEFFSITYGAGGSTRDGTRQLVLDYQASGSDVAPHLSFGGSDEAAILALLEQYKEAGVSRLVALRGDIPSGSGSIAQYRYANELVAFVREHTGDHFHIDVACYPEIHPESVSYDAELLFFKQKVAAGADSAITQYFYNPDAYFRFLENATKAGVNIPIVPGIMPISNYESLARFSSSCGAEIPRWLSKKLQAYGDDRDSLKAFGIDVVTQLCDTLLQGGAPSLHFYSMNQSQAVTQITTNLQASAN